MEELELKNVTEEEYRAVKPIIEKDNEEFKARGKGPYVTFMNYFSDRLTGVYFKGTLVGFVNLGYFRGDLEIQTYILPQYRGHNISYLLHRKVVEETSINYPTAKEIVSQVERDNEASLRVMEKLGWAHDYEHEEAVFYEEDKVRNVFYTLNPHYEKEKGITK